MTDREWSLFAPFLTPRRLLGRPRTTDLREVTNAILHRVSTGCQWRMLPRDFPPVSTAQRYVSASRDDGLFIRMSDMLVMRAREMERLETSPTAGVIDSQSAKTTDSRGPCRKAERPAKAKRYR